MLSLRRAIAAAATVMAGSLVVAACTTDASPPTPSPAPSPSPTDATTAADPVSLRLGVPEDRTMLAAYEKLAQVYTNANPHVTIDVEPISPTTLAPSERPAPVPDDPDLVVVPNDAVPGLSAADRVMPVDQLLAARGVTFGDTYLRLGLEAFSAEDALQCMPVDVSPLVVIYNQELVPFRRLIEPGEEPLTPETGWTWEQFAKAVRLMSRDGVKGVYVEPQLSTLMALARSAGVDIVDDPRDATTLTLSDPGTREALEQVLDVLREPRYTPTPEQLERVDALTRFARGKIGMIFATKAVVPELREVEELNFDVFPLPRLARARTIAEVDGLCLTSVTDQPEAAADFLAFVSGERGAAILAETGAVVPSYLATLNSLAFTQPGTQPESVNVFPEAVARASVTPYVLGWPRLVEATRDEVRELFYAPVIDLDRILPRLDATGERILEPTVEPTE